MKILGSLYRLGDGEFIVHIERGDDANEIALAVGGSGPTAEEEIVRFLTSSKWLIVVLAKMEMNGMCSTCRGDKTVIELFIAGVWGWEAPLRRRFDDGNHVEV